MYIKYTDKNITTEQGHVYYKLKGATKSGTAAVQKKGRLSFTDCYPTG